MIAQRTFDTLTLNQLLTGLCLSKQTGSITVSRQEDRDYVPNTPYGYLSLVEGNVVTASVRDQGHDLLTMLNMYGLLTDLRMEHFLFSYPESGEKALALLLVNGGYVSRENIIAVMRQRIAAAVYALTIVEDASIQFLEGQKPAPEAVLVPVSYREILEMRQRFAHLYDYRRELAVIVKFAKSFTSIQSQRKFGPIEWRVFSYIDNNTTAIGIARALHLSDLEIRQALFTLEQAGIIEFDEPPLKTKHISRRIETRELKPR